MNVRYICIYDLFLGIYYSHALFIYIIYVIYTLYVYYIHIYLSIYLSIYLFIYIYLSIYIYIYIYIYTYIYIYMPEVCTCQEYMHALNKCILEIYIFCSTSNLINYSFSCPSKALTTLYHRSVVRVQNKDYYFIFLVVFLSCNMCFYYFHFFFR